MPGFEIIGEEERLAVNQIFRDGGVLFAHGFDKKRKNFHVREFEINVSNYFDCKFSLAVSSGTAAIKIALMALGIRPGDEVITQGFNFIATIEAILDCGAIPIIANVDKSLNMDPQDCESLITNKTKVILPVHMLGVPADMYTIMKIAEKHKLKVLEDNCESVGGKYNDKFLGCIGDAGVFSYDYGKVITCGEGGMVVTNSSSIDKYSREYHDHGHENNPQYPRGQDTKTIYGFNYRMTELQGAIGKEQLKKLDFILEENEKRYNALLKYVPDNVLLRKIPKGSKPVYDTLIFFVEHEEIKKKYINILTKEMFGTKNLPDAIEWHCSAFWDHALNKETILRTKKTKKILERSIAIPIWLTKSVAEYSELGKKLFHN
jgi:8-amino-3,8-dideoxy-alpha-D-manno-octulosonate transaminase